MRLINTRTLKLVHFVDADAPSYVILSHTWDDDEISFQEMENPTASTYLKKGYHKIVETCEQAKRDGADWVWIDTCGIDKSSSAELSEVINSMFRYYREAQCCYVYLVDCHYKPSWVDAVTLTDWQFTEVVEALRKCRWFSRGWTLQELLAPTNLKVFSSSWELIGDKKSLCKAVSAVTGIHIRALQEPWSVTTDKYSIAQKLSWAANRRTTRNEDRAYSLLGLFGVSMPLLYGEGSNAFLRLQEEIIRISDDQTVFVWSKIHDLAVRTDNSLLAPDPDCFKSCAQVIPWKHEQFVSKYDYNMSNRGLYITIPVIQSNTKGEYYGVFGCRYEDNLLGPIAVRLWLEEDGTNRSYEPLTGVKPRLKIMNATKWAFGDFVKSIYIKRQPSYLWGQQWNYNAIPTLPKVVVRSLEIAVEQTSEWNMTFEQPEPREHWNEEGRTLRSVVAAGSNQICASFIIRLSAAQLSQIIDVRVQFEISNLRMNLNGPWTQEKIVLLRLPVEADCPGDEAMAVATSIAKISITDGMHLEATISRGTMMDHSAFAIDTFLS